MPICTVEVIGTETAGDGIAQAFATSGFDVVITDARKATGGFSWREPSQVPARDARMKWARSQPSPL
jgi:3-hydroxyacyl-CoA dehydrogenase